MFLKHLYIVTTYTCGSHEYNFTDNFITADSDWGSHNHLYRIRKDSEGSIEIFPELVEEDCVITEFKDPVLSRNGSWGELPKDESLGKTCY